MMRPHKTRSGVMTLTCLNKRGVTPTYVSPDTIGHSSAIIRGLSMSTPYKMVTLCSDASLAMKDIISSPPAGKDLFESQKSVA
jgi:hypothetical protein